MILSSQLVRCFHNHFYALKNWGQCPTSLVTKEKGGKKKEKQTHKKPKQNRQGISTASSQIHSHTCQTTFSSPWLLHWGTAAVLPVASLHFTLHIFQCLAVCPEKRMSQFFPKAITQAERYLLVCHWALFLFTLAMPGFQAAVTSHGFAGERGKACTEFELASWHRSVLHKPCYKEVVKMCPKDRKVTKIIYSDLISWSR